MVESSNSANYKIEQYEQFKEEELEKNPNITNNELFRKFYYKTFLYAKRAYLVYLPVAVFFR
jgi:hypothetical protein